MPKPKKSLAGSVREAFGTPEAQQEGPSFLDRLMSGLRGEGLGSKVTEGLKKRKKKTEDAGGY